MELSLAMKKDPFFENDPFGPGMWQDFVTMLRHLEQNGRTPADAFEYVERLKKRTAAQIVPEAINRRLSQLLEREARCPKCGELMQLLPGDDGDSHWACRRCRYGRYNKESVAAIQKRMARLSWRKQKYG
jgi:hypothetical protein